MLVFNILFKCPLFPNVAGRNPYLNGDEFTITGAIAVFATTAVPGIVVVKPTLFESTSFATLLYSPFVAKSTLYESGESQSTSQAQMPFLVTANVW